MITGKELYNVLSAVLPLYLAMLLGYGSVRWWHVFTREQCSGVNRFVALFTVPLLSFDFVCNFNPYEMNLRFLVADVLSKALVLVPLIAWFVFGKRGNFDWLVSIFSMTTLANTLIMGIPLVRAMYGRDQEQIIVQVVVLQVTVWRSMLILLMEIRNMRNGVDRKVVSKIDDGKKEENGLDLGGIEQLKEKKSLSFHGVELKEEKGLSSDGVHQLKEERKGFSSNGVDQLKEDQNCLSLQDTDRLKEDHNCLSLQDTDRLKEDQNCLSLQDTDRLKEDHNDFSFHGVEMKEEKVLSSHGVDNLKEYSNGLSFQDTDRLKQVPNGSDHVGICELGTDLEEKHACDLEKGAFEKGSANGSSTLSIGSPGHRQVAPSLKVPDGPSKMEKWMGIVTAVGIKLLSNPNVYASVLGLTWSLISFRWKIKRPLMMENCTTILSRAALGTSMFSVGLFMASQPRIISCGKKLALFGMVLRFIVGPLVVGVASAMVGLRGRILKVAIVQVLFRRWV